MKNRLLSLQDHPIVALAGVGVSYFGSLLLAVCFYPHPYFWRQTVMSSLASPRDNPHAYGIACAGMATGALWLLPFPALLHRRLARYAPRATLWAGWFLLIGAVLLVLTGLVVPGHYRVLGVRRVHEQLARTAAGGLCLALILYLRAVCRLPRAGRWLRVSALVFVAVPVAAFLFSRLVLVAAYACWPASVYRAATVSSWGSLALWEWVGAGSVYIFLALITLGLSEAAALDPAPPP